MHKFSITALANTFAIIDIVLHTFFRLWIWLAPYSYEQAMNLFIAGFRPQVTEFDISLYHIVWGTLLEAAGFWILGALVAIVYNTMLRLGTK